MHTLGRPENREQRPENRDQRIADSEQRTANRDQRTENREQKDLRRAYCKTDVYVQYSMYKEPEDPGPVQEANCHWAYVGARRRIAKHVVCCTLQRRGGRERERERGGHWQEERSHGPGHRPPIRLGTRVLESRQGTA